jgi:hypothetical protein
VYSHPEQHTYAGASFCLGRSDTRQFGVCVPFTGCTRGLHGPAEACTDPEDPSNTHLYPEFGTSPCVCVVFHNNPAAPDGLADHGAAMTDDACRAYRSMYPGAVDCVVDAAWHTLP